MATRTVTVTLNAAVGGFVSGMNTAAQAAQNLSQRLEQGSQHRQAWDQVGTTMTRVGAVAAAGLGAAAKAAIDWESAFAGVRKTVDGSPQQIAALEGELRTMAKTMATSHADIASVAEAAGQLGVATEDVADFSRTMIMLGETTNMSADEAATSMAQLMTIMGTAPDQVDNLGAALAGLGNNSATTESQILQMSQRIAGAGTAIGLTEADVMGFSAAIASTGVEVEAGGTAISTSMLKMEQAVRAGGKELDLLARTAGMSAAEFKTAFQDDAAGAIQAFVEGLGRVGAAGGDVTAILSDLGITGIREADTLRRLANAGTLLGDSLAMAGDEFSKGSALMDEYGQRAETTESKIRVAWNNIVDAGITMGGALLPVVAGIAQGAASIAAAFGALPGPVQQGVVAITALAAGGGLAIGAAMKLAASVADTVGAFRDLGVGAALADSRVRRFAVGAAAAAAGFMVVQGASAALRNQMDEASASVEDYVRALEGVDRFGRAGLANMNAEVARFGDTWAMAGRGIESTADLFVQLESASNAVGESFRFIGDSLGMTSSLGALRDEVDKLDQALTQMEPEAAAEAFRRFSDEMTQAGISMADQMDLFDDYGASFEDALTPVDKFWAMLGRVPPAVRDAAAAAEGSKGALESQADGFDAVADAARDAASATQEFAAQSMGLWDAETGAAKALDAARESIEKHGQTLDVNTKAGQANRDMLSQLAQSHHEVIAGMTESDATAGEMAARMGELREVFLGVAEGMGMSRPEAEALANDWGLVANQAGNLASETAVATQSVQEIGAALAAVPADTEVTLKVEGQEDAKTTVDGLVESLDELPPNQVVEVTMPNGEPVRGKVHEILTALQNLPVDTQLNLNAPSVEPVRASLELTGRLLADMPKDATLTISGDGIEETQTSLSGMADELKGLPGNTEILVTMPNGEQVLTTVGNITSGIWNLPDGEVQVTALGAEQAAGLIRALQTDLVKLDPEKRITVSAPGIGEVQSTVAGLKGAIDGVPDEKLVSITLPNGQEVILRAGDVRAAIEGIENRDVLLTVDASGAITGAATGQSAIDATHGKTNPLDVDPSGAIEGSATGQGAIDATHGKTNPVDADPSGAISGSAVAQGAINAVDGVTRQITVSSNASSAASSAQAAMNAVRNVVRTITIRRMFTGGGSAMMGQFADGGMIPAAAWAPTAAHAGAQRLASGGSVGGVVAGWSPHPRADNIPLWGTAGEVMMSNRAGDLYGRDRFLALNSGRVDPRAFAAFMNAQGLADGGSVRYAPPLPAQPQAAGKVVNQTFNTYYPVSERESTATRRNASNAALAAIS